MRRREFLASSLAIGAAPTTAAATSAATAYTLAPLPAGAWRGATHIDPRSATEVEFVAPDALAQSCREVIAGFRGEHPEIDLADPNAFLILAKPLRAPGAYQVADCVCQCGHVTTNTSSCGGGGGGGSKARRANTRS